MGHVRTKVKIKQRHRNSEASWREHVKRRQGVKAQKYLKYLKYHDRLYRSRGMSSAGSGSVGRSDRETTGMEEGVRT